MTRPGPGLPLGTGRLVVADFPRIVNPFSPINLLPEEFDFENFRYCSVNSFSTSPLFSLEIHLPHYLVLHVYRSAASPLALPDTVINTAAGRSLYFPSALPCSLTLTDCWRACCKQVAFWFLF